MLAIQSFGISSHSLLTLQIPHEITLNFQLFMEESLVVNTRGGIISEVDLY